MLVETASRSLQSPDHAVPAEFTGAGGPSSTAHQGLVAGVRSRRKEAHSRRSAPASAPISVNETGQPGGYQGDAAIVGMAAQWRTARDEFNAIENDADPRSTELSERMSKLQIGICSVVARAPEGLAAKAGLIQEMAPSIDEEVDAMTASLVDDLRRLAPYDFENAMRARPAADAELAAIYAEWKQAADLQDRLTEQADALPLNSAEHLGKEKEVDAASDLNNLLRSRLLAIPATSVRGAAIKAAVFAWLTGPQEDLETDLAELADADPHNQTMARAFALDFINLGLHRIPGLLPGAAPAAPERVYQLIAAESAAFERYSRACLACDAVVLGRDLTQAEDEELDHLSDSFAQAQAAVMSARPRTGSGLIATIELFERRNREHLDTPQRELLSALFASVKAFAGVPDVAHSASRAAA